MFKPDTYLGFHLDFMYNMSDTAVVNIYVCMILQAIREQLQSQHWEAHNKARAQLETQQAARDQAAKDAKVDRIQHFRKREQKGQVLRELKSSINENNQAVFRSIIV